MRTPVLVMVVCGLLIAGEARGERAKYDFNAGWKVFVGDPQGAQLPAFDDSAWKTVTTPYAWNEDDAFRLGIAQLPTGVAWYRKHFKLPPSSEGKKVILEFEGVRFAGEFWVNGVNVGLHENGVMAFGLDITNAVRAGEQENVLACRIDSAWNYQERATGTPYQWNDRNFNVPYGGINKAVTLHVMDKLYQTLPLFSNLGTTGVYVYASNIAPLTRAADVNVESQVRNEDSKERTFSFDVAILDTDGRQVRSFGGERTTLQPGETKIVKAGTRIDNLNLWSWGYGYLYTVQSILKIDGQPTDVVATRTGFRKTEFGNGVMKLNGRVIHLKGYAQRTTNEWPGVGIDIPPWVSDFSNRLLVQSHGNLVRWMHVTPSKQDVESCDRVGLMQAMPAGDAESDATGRRWENRVRLMRDAIIYNRNNPSIVFYESGNKGISDEHMREMVAVRDAYDPHGGRATGSREMLGSQVAEWGGEMLYVNKSAGKPLWMTEYSRDEGLRKWWDEFSPPFHANGTGQGQAPEYNRNQDSHVQENVLRWYEYWTERPGTGKRVNGGGVNIIFSDTNTHHRGSENYRRSGEVDAMRIPKQTYFAHQVMWNGWVDVEKPGIHIVGHWNYQPGTKKNVYVVSSADRVELLINGQSKGRGQQSNRFLFTFSDIEWQPGTVTAVGFDSTGKKLVETQLKTAGDPVAIRLTPHIDPSGFDADGSDLALVDVEVVDAQGQRCPIALNTITFELTGPAQWRGGIAQGPDNYILSKSLPVEGGVNRVIVRSSTEAGPITLTAKSDGLKEAVVTLQTRPVEVTDGWSLKRRNEGIASYLDRGPTPVGDSVTPTRKPVLITSATAGAGADRAAASFDDNEVTSWNNGGDRANGWIRYDLLVPTPVSEVTMKLGNFRTTSYPIRILVDGKEVFKGDTPRSLGYSTFKFPPTTGKSVRIELVGATTDRDAFGNIVEVTGEKLIETTRPAGQGTLNLIEVEIYEPLN